MSLSLINKRPGSGCCFFCCKTYDKSQILQKKSNSNSKILLTKFFQILQSHLQDSFTFKHDIRSVQCCGDCRHFVEAISTLFVELKCLELKLQWKLDSLLKVLNSNGDDNPNCLDDEVLGSTSNGNAINLRKELVQKCSAKKTKMEPKILLQKLQVDPSRTTSFLWLLKQEPKLPSDINTFNNDDNFNDFDDHDFTEIDKPVPMDIDNKDFNKATGSESVEDVICNINGIELPEPLKCSIENCPERFSLPEELENHSRMHGEFRCSKCPLVLKYAPNLAVHEVEFDHEQTSAVKVEPQKDDGDQKITLQCPRCPKFRIQGTNLKLNNNNYVKHFLRTHLNLPWSNLICPICSKMFYVPNLRSRRWMKRSHFRVYHDLEQARKLAKRGDGQPLKIQRCDQCPAYFVTKSQLYQHKVGKHTTSKNVTTYHNNHREKCKLCGKMRIAKNMRRHIEVRHKLEFKVPCTFQGCSKKFLDQEELQAHIEHRHLLRNGDLQKKLWTCDTCGQGFLGIAEFKGHQEKEGHSQKVRVKPNVVCDECGKEYKKINHLNRHMLSHRGPDAWPLSCDICGKKCMNNQQLNRHRLTHSGEKPFQCAICGSRYQERRDFRNHVLKKHGPEEAEAQVPWLSSKPQIKKGQGQGEPKPGSSSSASSSSSHNLAGMTLTIPHHSDAMITSGHDGHAHFARESPFI